MNVPDRVVIRLHTDAHSTTGSRCRSTRRASGYTAVSASRAIAWCGLLSVHRPRTPPLWSTCSTVRWYSYAERWSAASSHRPYVGHVGDRLPRQALEVLAHHRDALGGAVGLLVVDRPRSAGLSCLEHLAGDAAPRRPAGPARWSAGVGGGTLSPASHRRSGRFAGSWSSRWLRNVVPARNMPITTIGASMRSSATSGCACAQSTTRSRLARLPTIVAAHRRVAELVQLRLRRRPTRTYDREALEEVVGTEVVEAGGRTPRRASVVGVGIGAPVRRSTSARRRRRCGPTCAAARGPRARPRPRPCAMRRPMTGRIAPSATSSSSAAWTSPTDLGRERVDAESPELERQRRCRRGSRRPPRSCHRHLAQRPAGEPRLGVVVEPDRQVAPPERHARPHRLGLLAADRGRTTTSAPWPSVCSITRVEDVVGRVVDRPLGPELRGTARPSRARRRRR